MSSRQLSSYKLSWIVGELIDLESSRGQSHESFATVAKMINYLHGTLEVEDSAKTSLMQNETCSDKTRIRPHQG